MQAIHPTTDLNKVDWNLLVASLPFLIAIGYLMATAMLRTIAFTFGWEIELHNKIKASKKMRAEYLASLSVKQSSNVDIL